MAPTLSAGARAQHVEQIMQAWEDFRARIPADSTRLRWFAFDRLVTGRRATLDEAAKELGISPNQVRAAADTMARWGLMTVDAAGIITGSMGLTVEPTEYDFVINGRALHTWCALDAVGIAAGRVAEATIRVADTAHVEIVAGRVVKANPPDLRISLPHPQLDRSIRQTLCPTICFHAGPGPEHPGVAWITLDEAGELGRRLWARPEGKKVDRY